MTRLRGCMFDDTGVYACLCAEVLPLLRTWPSPRVWQLGLAVPEDPWALAVLLHEAGVLGKTKIYATDPEAAVLARSARAEPEPDQLRRSEARYRASGGRACLDEYWLPQAGRNVVRDRLRERVSFFQYDSRYDAPHNEFQLIVWRAPDEPASDARVASIVDASVARWGVVAFLGREPPAGFRRAAGYETLAAQVFRKVR